MNDPVYYEMAQAMGQRIVRHSEQSIESRLGTAFQIALSRDPAENEVARFESFVERQKTNGASESHVWTLVCQVLLNLDEFVTKE